MTARILVTGSRWWDDETAIAQALDQAWVDLGRPVQVVVVHGQCPYGGADLIAAQVAVDRAGWEQEAHAARWDELGKSAGPVRNQEMVDLGADVVLAFPQEGSRGTWDCVRRAQGAGMEVRVVRG